jgi:polysaccharide biosynthesis/export protein
MRSTTTATITKWGALPKRTWQSTGITARQGLLACIFASSLLTHVLAGQNTGGATAPSPQSSQFTTITSGVQNIPISPGDLLDVEVFNTPELSAKLRVDQMGRITPPLGGDVEVQGLNVAAAANALKVRFIAANIMLHPAVMVNIVEYATEGVTVLGEVRSPGIYTLLGPHSLYDAIASAGGASSSEGATITVTHANEADRPIIVKVTTPNYSAEQKATVIQPGDTIVVSRADLVYIVGDVTRSGAFFIQNGQPLTVLDLVSLAQGTTRTSAMSHVSIVRPTPNGGALTIPLNLNKVMKNEAKNIVLESGDILVVPRSGWKTFETTALPAITNAAANAVSVAIVD